MDCQLEKCAHCDVAFQSCWFQNSDQREEKGQCKEKKGHVVSWYWDQLLCFQCSRKDCVRAKMAMDWKVRLSVLWTFSKYHVLDCGFELPINRPSGRYVLLDTIFNCIFYFGPPGKHLYLSPQNQLHVGRRSRPTCSRFSWLFYRCFPGGPK